MTRGLPPYTLGETHLPYTLGTPHARQQLGGGVKLQPTQDQMAGVAAGPELFLPPPHSSFLSQVLRDTLLTDTGDGGDFLLLWSMEGAPSEATHKRPPRPQELPGARNTLRRFLNSVARMLQGDRASGLEAEGQGRVNRYHP